MSSPLNRTMTATVPSAIPGREASAKDLDHEQRRARRGPQRHREVCGGKPAALPTTPPAKSRRVGRAAASADRQFAVADGPGEVTRSCSTASRTTQSAFANNRCPVPPQAVHACQCHRDCDCIRVKSPPCRRPGCARAAAQHIAMHATSGSATHSCSQPATKTTSGRVR